MGNRLPKVLFFHLFNLPTSLIWDINSQIFVLSCDYGTNITYMGSKIPEILSPNLVNAANKTYTGGERPKFCPLIWLMVPASLHGKLSAKSV